MGKFVELSRGIDGINYVDIASQGPGDKGSTETGQRKCDAGRESNDSLSMRRFRARDSDSIASSTPQLELLLCLQPFVTKVDFEQVREVHV